MRYILAFDSFKGAANSAELNAAAAQAIIDLQPDAEIIAIDIADGGEGFAQSFAASLHSGVKQIECPTVDPLGRPITATYFRHGNQAIMELAAASGLPLLAESERNPMIASTSGTGLMMRHAISAGCGEILLGIGGSATNDAATGILAALGFEFLDNEGNVITPNGENLARIARIKNPDTKFPKIKIACDVSNPFCGPNGAAYLYAAQKGASKSDIALLDKGLWQFAQVINRRYNTDITNLPGAGAAGGVG